MPAKANTLVFSFDVAQVERIQVGGVNVAPESQPYFLITMVKAKQSGASNWRIPDLMNAEADRRKIEGLVNQIREAKTELTASGSSFFDDFGVGNEDGVQVNFFDGEWNPLLTLIIGVKQEGGYSFIRQSGSDRIYRTPGNLLESAGIDLTSKRPQLAVDYWLAGKAQMPAENSARK